MVDRVQPLKLEDAASGGTQLDPYPRALDRNEDFIDARGLTVQDATSNDDTVRVERDGSDRMVFLDGNNPSGKTLDDLAASGSGISAETHKVLRQLIHFIDNGPAEGFATGAYRETLPLASAFPTSVIWYESAAKLKKIVEKTIVYTGAFPTTITWEVYDVDGTTVLATVADTIVYSGAFETNRTRAIS